MVNAVNAVYSVYTAYMAIIDYSIYDDCIKCNSCIGFARTHTHTRARTPTRVSGAREHARASVDALPYIPKPVPKFF